MEKAKGRWGVGVALVLAFTAGAIVGEVAAVRRINYNARFEPLYKLKVMEASLLRQALMDCGTEMLREHGVETNPSPVKPPDRS